MKIQVGYEFIYNFPAGHSDDPDDQCPLLAGIGYRRSGSSDNRPTGPHHRLPGRLRKLVQPDRSAARPDTHRGPRRRERYGSSRRCRSQCYPARGGGSAGRNPGVPAGQPLLRDDLLSATAWQLFGNTAPGWARVQAICDFVHNHIAFDYQQSRPTRTAWEAFNERKGVCRDYAHLAVTFCRCMNIPARYCTGYLGDIGMPPPYGVMDLAAWFDVYLGGRWYSSMRAITCRASDAF